MTPTVFSECLPETRAFYERAFGARILLDNGWYLHLSLDLPGAPELSFEKPKPKRPPFRGGLAINLEVEKVDEEWERLVNLGFSLETPPADHPWGDRSFTLLDPNGIVLYLYATL